MLDEDMQFMIRLEIFGANLKCRRVNKQRTIPNDQRSFHGYEDIEKGKKNFKGNLTEDEPYYDSSDYDSFQSDEEEHVSDDELEGGSLRGRNKSNKLEEAWIGLPNIFCLPDIRDFLLGNLTACYSACSMVLPDTSCMFSDFAFACVVVEWYWQEFCLWPSLPQLERLLYLKNLGFFEVSIDEEGVDQSKDLSQKVLPLII
uniref:Uncharacterized protein n=1 Tax=Solanum lycopersicum TaxID=4081 RepID=A0A3Q7GHY0_SOLLC